MAAYVVFTRIRTDNDEELKIYAGLAVPTLQNHPVKPLAFYGTLDVLEGPALEGAVVLEFPSSEAARAWYNSKEYQKALPHRKAGADYSVFIVDGVTPAKTST
jgi:uncharacterized protein (DUF1330 family)